MKTGVIDVDGGFRGVYACGVSTLSRDPADMTENSHTRIDFRAWLFSVLSPLFGSFPIVVLFRYCFIGNCPGGSSAAANA